MSWFAEDDAPDDDAPIITRERRIVVGDTEGRVRLDRYLLERGEGLSRTRIQRLIEAGDIRVGGGPARPGQIVRAGDEILVRLPAPRPLDLVPEDIPLDILYEDEHLVAVNKAAGMVVHPAAGHDAGTLVHALLAHCRELSGIGGALRPGIVHRLDRGTSGVLVVAKSEAAHQALQRMFKAREVEKVYLAVTLGTPRDREGTIRSMIARHPLHRQKMASVPEGGRAAVTRFRVLADYGRFAKVEARPETGRTHQIRVHLSDLGTPILGDGVYGRKTRAADLRDAILAERVRALDRPALHARRLAFAHPITGKPLELEAPVPADIAGILKRLDETARAHDA